MTRWFTALLAIGFSFGYLAAGVPSSGGHALNALRPCTLTVFPSADSVPYVARSALRIGSAEWVVGILHVLQAAPGAPVAACRDGSPLALAQQGDSIYVVLTQALEASGERDPHTDTAWTWLWAGTPVLPTVGPDSFPLAPDTTVVSSPQFVRWERDSLYYYGDRGLPYNNSSELTSGEGWYWTRLRSGSTVATSVQLPWLAAGGGSSTLRLRMHSSSAPQVTPTHAIIVSINGQTIDTVRWNGYQSNVATLPVPIVHLVQGSNTVLLRSLPTGASVNEVYVDWFELNAPQEMHPTSGVVRIQPSVDLVGRRTKFLVQGMGSDSVLVFGVRANGSIDRWPLPVRNGQDWEFTDTVVSGRDYVVAGMSAVRRFPNASAVVVPDLAHRPVGADYVIIAPRAFASSATRLETHRSRQGVGRTAVIASEDIYDAFGGGRWGPAAIRSFLLTVDSTWPAPAPSTILLLGDGTWDPKDNFQTGKRGILPTLGNPVSDALFIVDTVDRFRVRKSIGRLPVRTIAEADSIVAALIAYDSQPITEWNSRYLFFASGFDSLETLRFQQFSDGLFAQYLAPAPLAGVQAKIYRTVNQVVDFERTEEVRRMLDSGAVWINYYGHAGTDVWANGINRAEQLANAEGKAHLITDISCSTARFGEPLIESFGELMVRSTDARAMAYVGSSGFGYESPLRILAQGLFKAFSQGERSLGNLILAAKGELWKGGTSSLTVQQSLHQWTLLGDPAARLRIARWPEFQVPTRSIVVEPTEPSEQDSTVRIRYEVRNIGLLTPDSVIVRARMTSDGMTVTYDTSIAAGRRSSTLVLARPELRTPGFHVVTITVNPDSMTAEESHSGNEGEVRYVVSSSRFQVLSPADHSRRHPDSVEVRVLQPYLLSGSQTMDVEADTSASFVSPWRRSWSGIAVTPYATSFRIPSQILSFGVQYYLRVRLVAGTVTTPWVIRSFTAGATRSWVDDASSGFSASVGSGVRGTGTLRLHERSVPFRVFSAGFDDGLDASILIDGVDVSQGFVTRGYNVAVVNEVTGRLESFAGFSLYSDNPDTTFAEPLIQFLRGTPAGRRVLIGVADEAQRNKTERLNIELENIGGSKIRTLGFRGSWAISGWKGAPIGSVPEAISAAGQGSVTVLDTLFVRSDTGSVVSSAIGPAYRWKDFQASVQDTGSRAAIGFRVIRSTEAGTVDTVNIEPGPASATVLPERIRSIRLLAEFTRTPSSSSPGMTGWSVDYDGLPEPALSPVTSHFESDTVDAGIPFTAILPVSNAGESTIDTMAYRVRWRWPAGERILEGTLAGLARDRPDTIRVSLATAGISGVVTMEAVLDPLLNVPQWERGNDLLQRSGVVLPDTLRPRFTTTVDGRQIVDGDYVRPEPEIRIEIGDDGAVPISSPSSVALRLDGRRVALSPGTPDSLFESRWQERKAFVTYRPILPKGTHVIGVQVTDGSGNAADTSEHLLTMRVETAASLRNVVAFPNPFATSTDVTFNLTGRSLPQEGVIRIYTIAGRFIRKLAVSGGELQTGFNRIPWDGRDADGDEVANGVYLAVVKVKSGDQWLQETAKLAKIR